MADKADADPERARRAALLAESERTAHKRCGDCGRFVDKDRWTPLLAEQRKDPNAQVAFPLCDGCASEYDPPEW